ncbi:MAG: phosphatidylserine decarboxylase [Candidatus Omnitrophota bacterium]|jgi:phosphatidylserine decarboxylase
MNQRCPFDKRVLPGFLVLLGAWAALAFFAGNAAMHALVGFLVLFHLYFFRDPKRKMAEGDGPVSAADGKVVEISRVMEDRYLKTQALKIGIFLSVFDVHVTRAPENGTVEYLEYVPGKFLNALREESAKYNESNWIGLSQGPRRVLVRQIAGVIARRIRCDVAKGDAVEKGGKVGMICYGSRVEIFIPESDFVPAVNPGQKVYAGKTLLGTWRSRKGPL